MHYEQKITEISDNSLQEFKELYKKNFDEDITHEFARADALRLLNFIHIIYEIEFNTMEEQKGKD